MGALPKRKHSKGRRDRRRAHDFLQVTGLIACDNCGEKKQSHAVCPSCGQYRGRVVLQLAESK